MLEYNNLLDVMSYFSNEQTCKEHLAKLRWPDGIVICPYFNLNKVYTTKTGYKCSNKKCKLCFNVTVGTFFENTKIKLNKWFVAIYLVTAHKKGISSLQLSRVIKVTQKTAWFMLHRIREMLKDKYPDLLQGLCEVYETYVGGKPRRNFRINKRGRGTSKIPVLGIVERNGRVYTKVVSKTDAKT